MALSCHLQAAIPLIPTVQFSEATSFIRADDSSASALMGRKNSNEHLGSIAEAVPRFGGYYKDHSEGVMYVFVTGDSATAPVDEIREAYIREYGPDEFPPNGIRVLQAEYSMRSLVLYHSLVRSLLPDRVPEALSIDLAEQSNRVVVEVLNEEGRQKVLGLLEALGVPEGAVRIDIGEPSILYSPPPHSK